MKISTLTLLFGGMKLGMLSYPLQQIDALMWLPLQDPSYPSHSCFRIYRSKGFFYGYRLRMTLLRHITWFLRKNSALFPEQNLGKSTKLHNTKTRDSQRLQDYQGHKTTSDESHQGMITFLLLVQLGFVFCYLL